MAKKKISKKTVVNFTKFGLVGGSGVFVNTGMLYLLTNFLGLYYILASIFATETAIITNFLGNHFFTFKKHKDKTSIFSKFLKFQAISLFTLIATVFLLWVMTSIGGLEYLLLWNLLSIIATFALNFRLNCKITWKHD